MAKQPTALDQGIGGMPRRLPAIAIYLHPFRLVTAKGQTSWKASIDDVNHKTWDYVKLHEVVGQIDVGLQPPYNMVVSRDGALALPPIDEFRSDHKAIAFFNRALSALLLGGVYCEAVSLDNLEIGSLIDWKYLRIHSASAAGSNQFHNLIRLKMASPYQAINLTNPNLVSISALKRAMAYGLAVFDEIPNLSGDLLMKGVTGIARRDWGLALSNLWIVIEQLTEHHWSQDIISSLDLGVHIDGRKDQLSDTRMWTTATRLELLHQKRIVPIDALKSLSVARKARNALSHRGDHPNQSAAMAAYDGLQELMRIALPRKKVPLFKMDLSDHALSDPFKPREPVKIEPTHWMPIPKLPGEEELEKEEVKSRGRKKARP